MALPRSRTLSFKKHDGQTKNVEILGPGRLHSPSPTILAMVLEEARTNFAPA